MSLTTQNWLSRINKICIYGLTIGTLVFDSWLTFAAISNNGQLKRVFIIAESLAWLCGAFQTGLLLLALKRIKTIIEMNKSLRQTYRVVKMHAFMFVSL